METQELFDTVATHLMSQNSKSMDDTGGCAYRGTQGRKCAAGILIPPGKYSSTMEGLAARGLPFFKDNFDGTQLLLIDELQSIHDDMDPDFWRNRLRDVARAYKLEFKF